MSKPFKTLRVLSLHAALCGSVLFCSQCAAVQSPKACSPADFKSASRMLIDVSSKLSEQSSENFKNTQSARDQEAAADFPFDRFEEEMLRFYRTVSAEASPEADGAPAPAGVLDNLPLPEPPAKQSHMQSKYEVMRKLNDARGACYRGKWALEQNDPLEVLNAAAPYL